MQIKYAGFWIRFVALAIDTIFSMALFFVLGIFIGMIGAKYGITPKAVVPGQVNLEDPYMIISFGMQIIFSFCYYILIQGLTGKTLGKHMMGLKVINKNYTAPGIWRATVRLVIGMSSGVLCAIGHIFAGFTKEKRAAHDFVSGTYVVYEETLPSTVHSPMEKTAITPKKKAA